MNRLLHVAYLSLCTLLLFVPATGQPLNYPDLPEVARPYPEPALPAAFDSFTPPVDGSSPAATAPAFAEWTRTGGPDDTLVATGYRFSSYRGADAGKDTEFLVYGQTTKNQAPLRRRRYNAWMAIRWP